MAPNVLMWIFVSLLGAGTLVIAFTRSVKLGIHGVALAGFLAVIMLTTLPLFVIVAFGSIWLISLAIVAGWWTRMEKFGNWMAVVAPSFAVMVLVTVYGMAAGPSGNANTVQMTLPLPGGGVQLAAVVDSLRVEDTTPDERAKRYAAIMAEHCPNGVRYFADEAEPGTNQMGPTIQVGTVKAAQYRWDVKKTCDVVWLATTVHSLKYGANLNQTLVMDEARSYLADPAKRIAAVQFVDAEVVEFRLVDAGETPYRSLGMIPGKKGEMPTLTQFSNQPALGYALVAVLRDKTVRHYRVSCDIQFSSPLEIPGVAKPEKAEVPPNPKKYPPTVVTTPPSTTKTTTPTTETTPPSTSTSTTTTTPGTSTSTTTTTTPPSSTTTTTTETTSTTTTTTTSPPSSTTTTTNTKGDGPAPSGIPTDTTQGPVESEAPVETTQANPGTQPEQADPGQSAPGGTQEPTQQPVPTVEETGGAEPSNPHTGDVDPDAAITTTVQAMSMGGTNGAGLLVGIVAFIAMVIASSFVRRREIEAGNG